MGSGSKLLFLTAVGNTNLIVNPCIVEEPETFFLYLMYRNNTPLIYILLDRGNNVLSI